MTVSTTARKQNFAGGQANLTFTFKTIPDHPEYIKVVVVSSGTETLLTYSSDYTVALDSDGVGGVVTVAPSYSTGYSYTVYRETDTKQESAYDDYNQFPANTLEENLDRLTLTHQELSEKVDRSLALPVSSTGSGLTLPNPVAGKGLKWNSSADGLENTTVDIEDAIAEAASYASTASTQAGLAQAAAVAAAASESNALTSENNAAASESASATNATNIIAAATSATASMIAAATSATLAGNYATSAGNSAIQAVTSATLAQNYASTASTQATAASNSASSASTSQIAAATSATLAGNYATSAGTSAIAAATSATLAGNYATTASTAAASVPTMVRGTFTNATVTTGTMVITTSTLTSPYSRYVTISDSNSTVVIPDDITYANSSVTISMTSFLPIAGTWGYGIL